jgi:cytochrome P450
MREFMAVQRNHLQKNDGFLGLRTLNQMRNNPFQFFLDLAADQGGVAFFRFGPIGDACLVSDPELIRELLVKHADKLPKWDRVVEISRQTAVDNIAILEGDIWKKHRKLLTPAFHVQRIQAYLKLIEDHSLKLVGTWQDQQNYDMTQMMATGTMGIIGEILFDVTDIERDASELSSALNALLEQLIIDSASPLVLPKWLPTARHKRENAARKTMITYLDRLIRERRAEGRDHGDVLSALIQARDAENGDFLTDDSIRDELYSLFVAGYETTSIWLTWTLYVLAQHPEAQHQLLAEVEQVAGQQSFSLEILDQLEFMDRVLKETLRMYPPAWSLFIRGVQEDIVLADQTIPAGHLLLISPYVQHHLPQYWENPDDFDPSRFEGNWKSRIPAYAFMPFGGGPRVCLGSHMAEMEAKVFLATIIKEYEIELLQPDQQVWKNGGFTLHPYPEMRLRVKKRTSSS